MNKLPLASVHPISQREEPETRDDAEVTVKVSDVLQALSLGLLAAIAIYLSINLNIPAWVLFIGWVAHDAFSSETRTIPVTALQAVLGVGFALVISLLGPELVSHIGHIGIPASYFVVVTLVFFVTKTKKLNQLLVYFLGMISWFGYGADVSVSNALIVSLSILLGFAFAYLSGQLSSWLSRTAR